ncbi:MAG: hypothetical protein JST39_05345, partial [Bacteroidetes bacterium]|nr:hypothetical protein [Bacteroidota bacterium]
GYDIRREKTKEKKLPVRAVQLYIYANNIGLLWTANDKKIDPDYVSSIPNPRTLSIGMKIDF